MTTGMWIELVLCVVVTLAIAPFVAYRLAEAGYFFTRLESGDIGFVMRGNTLHRIIHDIRGYELVNGRFVPTTTQQKRPWLGLYWIGVPPFFHLHTFKIVKEVENLSGKTPDEWIKDKGEEMVRSLRFIFPRPFVQRTVELGDRIPVDLLLLTKFQVVDPYTPVFLFKGKFFELAGAIVIAAVTDVLKNLSLDEFVHAEKGEVGGILKGLKDPAGLLNKELEKQTGLRLVGISIPQYDPSDKAVREAMNAERIAQEQAKAKVAEAEGHAAQLKIRVEADASAQERLARARGTRIRETVATLASSLANPDVVARGAADVLEMEAATSPDSKLTTLVKGNTPPVVPIGGGGK